MERFIDEEEDPGLYSMDMIEIQRGVSQFLVMGYSNTICKKEPGELTQWALNKNATADIETYYEKDFEKEFLLRVI